VINTINDLDTRAYLRFNHLQSSTTATSVFRLISHSGDGYLYAVIVATLYLNDALHQAAFTKASLVAFLLEIPGFILLKMYIKRDRPFVRISDCVVSIRPSDKFSSMSNRSLLTS